MFEQSPSVIKTEETEPDAVQSDIQLASAYQPQINLLLTAPGISEPITAIRIIAEIGADMSVFETSKQLCSWAGLTPQNQESAGKKKTTRIARAGAYLKPLLVQIALAVSTSDKHIELKNKYQSLKKRRGGKKAVSQYAHGGDFYIVSSTINYGFNKVE